MGIWPADCWPVEFIQLCVLIGIRLWLLLVMDLSSCALFQFYYFIFTTCVTSGDMDILKNLTLQFFFNVSRIWLQVVGN